MVGWEKGLKQLEKAQIRKITKNILVCFLQCLGHVVGWMFITQAFPGGQPKSPKAVLVERKEQTEVSSSCVFQAAFSAEHNEVG